MNAQRLLRLARFASLLLAATALTSIAQASDADTLQLPQTVEIDLLFPRNGSRYGPSDEFPVVAAIQNLKASQLLRPSLYYFFGTGTYSDNATYPFTQTLWFQDGLNNTTGTDVLLWHGYGNVTAGDWFLAFAVDVDICYPDPLGSGRSFFHIVGSTSVVHFSVVEGGAEADLVAATADGKTCGDTPSATFNLTDLLPRPGTGDTTGRACPSLSLPSPTASPCKVGVDEAAAASISQAISAAVQPVRCALNSSTKGCPGADSGVAAHGSALVSVAVGLVAVGVGMLALRI